MRFNPLRGTRAGLAVLLTSLLAAVTASTPVAAAPPTWNGALDKSAISKLSFTDAGTRLVNFKVPYILCSTGINGVIHEQLYVPSIPVSGGRFAVTYHVLKSNPRVVISISGSISASEAVGTIHGQGTCDTGAQPFHANPGTFKPVAPPKTTCSASSCLASNGMVISVKLVDRTIHSLPQPQGSVTLPADPVLINGGVGVTVTVTDRNYVGPAYVNPGLDFALRLGNGVLASSHDPESPVSSGSGATYRCVVIGHPDDETTLTKGGSFGPKNVCFGAATPADRKGLVLYYRPGGVGAPVDAQIPLG